MRGHQDDRLGSKYNSLPTTNTRVPSRQAKANPPSVPGTQVHTYARFDVALLLCVFMHLSSLVTASISLAEMTPPPPRLCAWFLFHASYVEYFPTFHPARFAGVGLDLHYCCTTAVPQMLVRYIHTYIHTDVHVLSIYLLRTKSRHPAVLCHLPAVRHECNNCCKTFPVGEGCPAVPVRLGVQHRRAEGEGGGQLTRDFDWHRRHRGLARARPPDSSPVTFFFFFLRRNMSSVCIVLRGWCIRASRVNMYLKRKRTGVVCARSVILVVLF